MMKQKFVGLISAVILVATPFAMAAVPASYYDTADTSSPQALRMSLHEIIDDHTKIPYSSSQTDTWDVLELADQDPSDSARVLAVYKNASYSKFGGGNNDYNREHSWPKSYGFPNDGSDNYSYTDLHHLFISNIDYNANRGNKPFDHCDSGCGELVTEINGGSGGQGGDVSNWSNADSFEVWQGRRGNIARALMYMAVRYEGGVNGVTGNPEPDLILTDDRGLISASATGSNGSVAYMGLKSVLLQWHQQDPVDDIERQHNDTVFNYQGNRNPFVDHPEWVGCVFESVCDGGPADTTPPLAPTGLSGTAGESVAQLGWNASSDADLAGYHVYRATQASGPYSRVNSSLLSVTSYQDSNLAASTTYYYVVAALDTAMNQSAYSNQVALTTDAVVVEPPVQGSLWINEFHYDNTNTDVNEFVEVAGTAGQDLAGWTLLTYNGSDGSVYNTLTLSGLIPDQQNGFGTLKFLLPGLQNGAADGLALVNAQAQVVQLLSYEGVFTASSGAASGMTSQDVGVSESSSTAEGYSLQLGGSGSSYADFSWTAAGAETSGQVNTSQSFTGTTPVNQPPVASFSLECADLTCNFNSSASSDADGTIASYAWTFGDGQSSTSANPSHDFAATGSYTVTLMVTDEQGAQASASQTVAVTAPVVNQPPVASFSYTVNELLVDFVDSSSDAEGSLVSWQWNFGDGASSSQMSPSHQYSGSGSYQVTLTVTDAGGLSASQSQTLTVTQPSTEPQVLEKDLAVNGLGGSAGSSQYFVFDVPSDASAVTFTMSGGTGDADLYVKLGALPTSSDYDCRPYQAGNNEACQLTGTGRYYVMLQGYADFSGVSLLASYQVAATGGFSQVITDISVARRSWQYYQFDVGSNMSSLNISLMDGVGDADLYVKYNGIPSKRDYQCRSDANGNNENCTIATPAAGTWTVGIYGYLSSSGITLKVDLN